MEPKQYVSLEVKKGDFTFSFHMPNGASWGNAIDAAFEILQSVNKMSQSAAQAAQPVQEGE